MNTALETLENIEARPTGRGRPVNKATVRTRNAVLRALANRAKDTATANAEFTARDIAKETKIGRQRVALALRWLNKSHGVLAVAGNAPRSERGRPDLIYKLDASGGEASESAPKQTKQTRVTAESEEAQSEAA